MKCNKILTGYVSQYREHNFGVHLQYFKIWILSATLIDIQLHSVRSPTPYATVAANCKLGQPFPANCPNQPIKASNLTTANSLIYQNTQRQLEPSPRYRGEPHLLDASYAQLIMGCP